MHKLGLLIEIFCDTLRKSFKLGQILKFDTIINHTFTPKKMWIWALGLGFMPILTCSQNPKILDMKPKPNFFV